MRNNKAIAFFSGFPERRFTDEIARRLEKDLPVSAFKVQESELSEVKWFELDRLIEETKAGNMGTCLRVSELEIVRNNI